MQQHCGCVDARANALLAHLLEPQHTLVITRVTWIYFDEKTGHVMNDAGVDIGEIEQRTKQFPGAVAGIDSQFRQFAKLAVCCTEGGDLPLGQGVHQHSFFRVQSYSKCADSMSFERCFKRELMRILRRDNDVFRMIATPGIHALDKLVD